MADRNLKVTVRADVGPFTRGMNDAAKSTEKVGAAAQKSSQQAGSAFSRMAQSARDNSAAWSTVGGALTTYGAAVTGLAVATAAVGISYNTLRQTSVAALTTLTGSAEAAVAQMAKLDDFASNSPFSRSTFIEAQQQLLGFGMEAENVIPTLDAIQNAVAAFGGSNQDIADLAFIIAQVGAAGKITATDLMQFGQRGVDAATLIGSQMGMTGAQIRESITAGTLDADAAIAALTAGMQERFGGAAANVKETFAGAMDRVKAAVRDLSAEFTAILVDPEGGGLAVDGLNRLADALRAFQNLPSGVKNAVGVIGALSGVAALAGGAAMVAVPRLVALYDALGQMGAAGEVAQAGMRGLPKIIGGLAIAGAVYAGMRTFAGALDNIEQSARDAGPGINEVQRAISELADTASSTSLDSMFASIDLESMFRGAATPINSVADAMERVHNPNWYQSLTDAHGAFIGVTTESELLSDALGRVDEAMASMAASDPARAVAEFEALSSHLAAAGFSAETIAATFPLMSDALIGIEDDAARAAGAASALNESFLAIDPSILQKQAAEIRQHNQDILQSFIDLGQDINNTEVSLDGWMQGLEAQVEAAVKFAENIAYLRAQGVNEAFIKGLMEQGPDGALRAAQLAEAIMGGDTAYIDRANEIGSAMGGELLAGAQATLDGSDPLVVKAEARAEAMQVHQEKERLASVFYRDPVTMPVEADTSAAEVEIAETVLWAMDQTGIMELDADDETAIFKIMQWNALAESTTGLSKLDTDPTLAVQQLASWEADARSTVAQAKLDAEAALAEQRVQAWRNWASGITALSKVDAHVLPAQNAVLGLVGWIASQTATINVTARYAGGLNMGGSDRTRVSARAAGGVERRPMMMGPGYGPTNVILAGEPETRGEAFISNHPAYRNENLSYLRTAASWFGKVVVDAYAGGNVSRTPTPMAASAGSGPTRLARGDLDYLADRLLSGLGGLQRRHSADMVDATRARGY